MREILFRGKRKDNGEWIVGHLLRYEDGRARIIESRTDIFCFADDPDTTVVKTYEVAPETVGQFTGLTDKNGKKIFDGDIIEAVCDNSFGECIKAPVVVRMDDYELMWDITHSYEYEVIGNIHDNPELLGGGAGG